MIDSVGEDGLHPEELHVGKNIYLGLNACRCEVGLIHSGWGVVFCQARKVLSFMGNRF
jgi:hypothetical protein